MKVCHVVNRRAGRTPAKLSVVHRGDFSAGKSPVAITASHVIPQTPPSTGPDRSLSLACEVEVSRTRHARTQCPRGSHIVGYRYRRYTSAPALSVIQVIVIRHIIYDRRR